MIATALDIEALSRDERLRLLEDLWESLARDPSNLPLTDAQRAELDVRLDELDGEQEPTGIPWEDALRALRTRA